MCFAGPRGSHADLLKQRRGGVGEASVDVHSILLEFRLLDVGMLCLSVLDIAGISIHARLAAQASNAQMFL